MVVDDFHVLRAFRRPNEAHAKLVVDTNTVLTGAVALERFKPVPGWNTQVVQRARPVELFQFAPGHGFDVSKSFHALPLKQAFGVLAVERL